MFVAERWKGPPDVLIGGGNGDTIQICVDALGLSQDDVVYLRRCGVGYDTDDGTVMAQ